MKPFSSVISFLVLTFLFSCSDTSEQKFQQDGVTFTVPSGWKISEQEKLGEDSYYISLEKEGENSSGIITITWIADSLDLQQYLEIHKDELNSIDLYKTAGIKYGDPQESVFNTTSSLFDPFDFSVQGMEYEGNINLFYGNNKTVSVLRQGAVEDEGENKEGFETLEKSFKSE